MPHRNEKPVFTVFMHPHGANQNKGERQMKKSILIIMLALSALMVSMSFVSCDSGIFGPLFGGTDDIVDIPIEDIPDIPDIPVVENNFSSFSGKTLEIKSSFIFVLGSNADEYRRITITEEDAVLTVSSVSQPTMAPLTFTVTDENTATSSKLTMKIKDSGTIEISDDSKSVEYNVI